MFHINHRTERTLTQTILPIIPEGATRINDVAAVVKKDALWTYFVGMWPIYSHVEDDQASFRFIAAQLIESGVCRQVEFARALGQSRKRLGRAATQLRERGVASFFEKRKGRSGGSVLTDERLLEAQSLLNQGYSRSEVGRELEVEYSTLSKALADGRLVTPQITSGMAKHSTLSERTQTDARMAQQMGTACTRNMERTEAAFGKLNGAVSEFEPCMDVPNAGVLCAVPALLENGLLHKLESLGEFKGYYTEVHVLMTLAFMFLCRYRNIEQLQGAAPGEFGRLMGLDRIPEARTLRNKADLLAGDGEAEKWSAQLTRFWFEKYPHTTGFLYVDGHVKVYGGKAGLPRRYVSRQRLCLSGISFYWVNDALGQPFFVVEKQIDRGMLEALRTEIVPRLLKDIPGQPGEEELAADPLLHRFIIVFDREGYSPAFFKQMWDDHRIACMTYRKNKTEDWPDAEFETIETTLLQGEPLEMELAERETLIGSGGNAVAVKEIRRRTETGRQTSIVTSARRLDARTVAPRMFARWGQENFFAYAMHHFGIDQLYAYGLEAFPDPETVVNPEWRRFDRQRRTEQGKLAAACLKLRQMDAQKGADPQHKSHEKWQIKKADQLEEILCLEEDIRATKETLKQIPQHIAWAELPEKEQFKQLPKSRRTLLNTIGMICYRAETALAGIFRQPAHMLSASRSLLQDLFVTPADLLPDPERKELHIQLHGAGKPRWNRQLRVLLDLLNETETVFPGTELKMRFSSLSENPADAPDQGTP